MERSNKWEPGPEPPVAGKTPRARAQSRAQPAPTTPGEGGHPQPPRAAASLYRPRAHPSHSLAGAAVVATALGLWAPAALVAVPIGRRPW